MRQTFCQTGDSRSYAAIPSCMLSSRKKRGEIFFLYITDNTTKLHQVSPKYALKFDIRLDLPMDHDRRSDKK